MSQRASRTRCARATRSAAAQAVPAPPSAWSAAASAARSAPVATRCRSSTTCPRTRTAPNAPHSSAPTAAPHTEAIPRSSRPSGAATWHRRAKAAARTPSPVRRSRTGGADRRSTGWTTAGATVRRPAPSPCPAHRVPGTESDRDDGHRTATEPASPPGVRPLPGARRRAPRTPLPRPPYGGGGALRPRAPASRPRRPIAGRTANPPVTDPRPSGSVERPGSSRTPP